MFFEYEKEKPKLLDEATIKDPLGNLYVSKGLWRDIINSYERKEILDRLKDLIDRGVLSFPYQRFNREEVYSEFRTLRNSQSSFSKSGWVCNRLVSDRPLSFRGGSYYVPKSLRMGSKVSDLFTQKERMKVGHQRFLSPMRAWESENKSFLNYLFNPEMFNGDINDRALRVSLSMRSYIASQFKPESAKVIYNTFQAKRVLDFSAGWGDRLVGFLASNAESYIGIDPNSKLHEPYQKITDFCNTGKETRFICAPAEDADLTGVEVDFVFTSPPYFTLERYSNEDTQSWKRYPQMSAWLERFLFPTLSKCWDVLSDGGRILVNIADAYTNGKREEICLPMLRYMESLGATYEGVIGYEMGARPGKNMENIGKTFCEPIWVWSKGEAPNPKWAQDNYFGV